MNARFICPHCHSPIDPRAMDVAVSARAACRICPECDEPILLVAAPAPPETSCTNDSANPDDSPLSGEERRR